MNTYPYLHTHRHTNAHQNNHYCDPVTPIHKRNMSSISSKKLLYSGAHTHEHTHTPTYIYIYRYTHAHTHTYMNINTHIHTYIYTYTPTHIFTHIHLPTHTHAHIHTYPYNHAHINACIHTHTGCQGRSHLPLYYNCRGRSELRNILRGSFRESFWECILWSRSWKYVRVVLLWWSILCPLICYNSCCCCLFEIGIIFIVYNTINVIIIDAIKCDHHCYCNHHHYYQKCSVYILYCYCWLSLY